MKQESALAVRIGHGFDVHSLVEGRALVLGGVSIPHYKGLLGHSDADVLIHAVIDAILGAMALGDIGKHFPDSDERYKNIDSRTLLLEVYELMRGRNCSIANLDATIIAQAPRLRPYIESMRDNIAHDLQTNIDQINIKATTTENLGFVGKEEGIACHAVVLLEATDG